VYTSYPTVPAKSQAQANLMRAAERGASFPMAKKVRASMSLRQMQDFAATPSQPASRGNNLGKFLHPKKIR